MQPVEYAAELIGGDVVYSVERAVGRVHRTVKIKLAGILTQIQRHDLRVRSFAGGLHEHIRRSIDSDHFVSAVRHERGERAGAAAEIEKRFKLAAVNAELCLVEVCKLAVGDIAGERVVPKRQRPVGGSHQSSSF